MRPAISDYLAPARTGQDALWSWIVGCILIIVIYTLSAFAIYTLAYSWAPDIFYQGVGDYALLLISFLPLFIACFLIYRYWHKRPLLNLLTAASRFRWGFLFRGGLSLAIVYAAFMGIEALFFPENFAELTFNPNLSVFFQCLALTILLVPFQATSEEIFLRGYLNQALAKYFSPLGLYFSFQARPSPHSISATRNLKGRSGHI